MKGIDFNHLHHAYLLVGERATAEEVVASLFRENGVNLIGSPDYFPFKESLLGIDDARRIAEQAIRHAFTGKKIFFLAPEKMTHEAQNALLKTFEEPIAHTHFFLVLRDENVVLPTLRSRLQVVRLENSTDNLKEAQKFLSLSIKERLNWVKKFVDKEQNLSAFLDELLLELRSQKDVERVEKVYKVRLVSDDRGALSRLILEHLAVTL